MVDTTKEDKALTQQELNDQLMHWVLNGRIEEAIDTIVAGASIHARTPKGNNLLYLAASRKHEEMFDWLLEVSQKGVKIDLDQKNMYDETTLFQLVKEDGFTVYVDKLLQAGANPNIVNKDSLSALIQACQKKKLPEAQLLVQYGAQVNYQTPFTKNTPFISAAVHSSLPICQLLMENGADYNAVDNDGKNALINALSKSKQFMDKQEKEEHKQLCLFLINSPIDLNHEAQSGMTALWVASLHRDKEFVMEMLSKGVNGEVWHDFGMEGNMSAMHLWCNSKEEDLVRSLHAAGGKLGLPDAMGNLPESYGFANPVLRDLMLELNADVNAVYHPPKQQRTEVVKSISAISIVISGGDKQKDMVQEMVNRGAKVSFDDPILQQSEPLFVAIANSAVETVEILLQTQQIDPNRLVKISTHSPGITPLMAVTSEALSPTLSKVLSNKVMMEKIKKGMEENKRNGVKSELINEEEYDNIVEQLEELSKFEDSLKENREKIFKMLLTHKANVDEVNEDGQSAIFMCKGSHGGMLLKQAHADLFLKDNKGNNPLVDAVINNKEEMIGFLKKEYQEQKDLTIENIFYQLAFTEVSSHIQQSSLEQGIMSYIKDELTEQDKESLKDKDGRINIKGINYQDEDGNTALLVAAANDLPFLVKTYFVLGADINLKNHIDETPLMHAIASKNPQMVEFFIEHGADVHATTTEGKSVLDFATDVDNKEILEKVKIALGHQLTEGSLSGVKKLKR